MTAPFDPLDEDNPFDGSSSLFVPLVPIDPDDEDAVEMPFVPVKVIESAHLPAVRAQSLFTKLDKQAQSDLRAAKKRFGDAWPKGDWLETYLHAATPLTSAPVEFHLAAGISAIGTLLGNRIYTDDFWGQNIYPNLWTVVVAPSGFYRKSTSINMTSKLIRDAGFRDAFYPGDASREALLDEFSHKPSGVMVLGEFGSFLANAGRDYNAGTKEDLTRLYDAEDEWTRKLRKETFTICRPAINIFGATTINWLEDRVTTGDLMGGFLARITFVTAEVKCAEREFVKFDALARNELIAGLARIARIGAPADPLNSNGEQRLWLGRDETPTRVSFSESARSVMTTFFRNWEDEVRKGGHSSTMDSFGVRLQTATIKLSMIFHASAYAFDSSLNPLTIDKAAVEQAIAYVRVLWANVTGLIDRDFATDRDALALRTIRDAVRVEGTPHSELMRKTGSMKSRDFASYIETLIERDEIRMETVTPKALGIERKRQRDIKLYLPGPAHRLYEQHMKQRLLEARVAPLEALARGEMSPEIKEGLKALGLGADL